jgi:aldose 1-epimerase
MRHLRFLRPVIYCAMLIACSLSALSLNANSLNSHEKKMVIIKSSFGTTPAGQEIHQFQCVNENGLEMRLITYGAIMTEFQAPDRDGQLENITLGFPNLEGYLQRHPYFGSTVGRYANRIAKGRFTLEGKQYQLATNNGPNHLHGGDIGFDKRVWDAQPQQTDRSVGVRFSYTSPDGEEGYPGTLKATVVYQLTNDNELRIDYSATTDAPTILNLTNHTYWNLASSGGGQILDHKLMLAADHYLPVDSTLIPTGEKKSVQGTPFDFTQPERIGARIDQVEGDPPGYDHCFVLRSQDGSLAMAARVTEPNTGRVMEVSTTQPGIQFYTGNFLSGLESDGEFKRHEGFCLETQHYPDSPNRPEFPSVVLRPGEEYRQTTVHKFSTQ